MDYTEHIVGAAEYIEQNLTSEINLTVCAKACGYSEYHFLRVLPSKSVKLMNIASNSLKLYESLSFATKPFCITPEIVTLPGISLTV